MHSAGHLPVSADKTPVRSLDDETPGSLMLLDDGALFLQVGDPHVDTGGQVFRSNNVMSSIVVYCHLLPVLVLLPLQDVDVRGLGQEQFWVAGDTSFEMASHAQLGRGETIGQGGVAVHEEAKVLIVAPLHEVLDGLHSTFNFTVGLRIVG